MQSGTTKVSQSRVLILNTGLEFFHRGVYLEAWLVILASFPDQPKQSAQLHAHSRSDGGGNNSEWSREILEP